VKETGVKALVVYESMFGNTQAVANAVAQGLRPQMEVEVHEVTQAPQPVTETVDLIVVGGPTHAFSLSRPATRNQALAQGATQGREDLGLREWLAQLRKGPHSELVAAFDTRVQKARWLPGSAAKKAAKVARSLGYAPAGKESFYVVDTSGPMVPGELDRAEAWGRELATTVTARVSGRHAS
jgi:hypothetical protein